MANITFIEGSGLQDSIFGKNQAPIRMFLEKRGEALLPYLFYPFDFISMQPVDGTRHRLLR